MISCMRHILGWAAGGLILIAASAQPASAAGPYRPAVPAYVPGRTIPVPRPAVGPLNNRIPPPGWDWQRTYPWSPYNAWKNPYWYPPYNPNYPYPPGQVYPYYPNPVPAPWGSTW